MKEFGNIILHEKIHETRHAVVYRGRKNNAGQSLIIKVLKTKYPIPSEIARFRQEYNRVKNLDMDGIVKIYDLIEYDNRFGIIEEDFDGISLKERIRTKIIDLESFLHIAKKLSETLGLIHTNNIIHLAIKPENIMVNVNQNTVKITNFGISEALTNANDEIYDPAVIEGVLSYMSPEQTGRMNRAVDYRSDMYSLGITCYEMLTGQVPFLSKDPMELIHSHIARQPAPPHQINTSIPPVISHIILKLLMKTPEMRYQNGFGLLADIEECLKQLSSGHGIKEFPLASKDISIKFNIPQVLVGREEELKALMSTFETSSMGSSEMLLVLGHPGIGKSALINELQRPIVAKKGYFISGKFDQFRKDVPFSSIIQAFQGLIKQLLSESNDRISLWRENLLAILGPNGKVMTDVIPNLEFIIGKQPDVESLGPEESKNRFDFVFQNFISVFTSADHPMALFLDDLQWADMASLKFINTVMTSSTIKYLYLIGAYRDNEVSSYHPLSITLDEIRKKGRIIYSIYLSPLNISDVNKMIMTVLRCGEKESFKFAELIHNKTGGNPFFINQFMKNLYDDRIIELDPKTGWIWDMDKIQGMRFTDNVVEFMAGKLSDLPADTLELVKVCACIGNRFDLETLVMVLEEPIENILANMTMAIQEGLVSLDGTMYKFHHDRIQEAAYSLIPGNEKARLHYRIGKNVLENTKEKHLDDKIFYIVDQLNRGIYLISEGVERLQLAELNLNAAKKAKNSTAYASALSYSRLGIGLLPENSWEKCYSLTYDLYNEILENDYLTGEYDHAEKTFNLIIKNAKTNLEKANVHSQMIILKNSTGDYESALEIGFAGMEMIGMKLPRKVSDLRLGIELLKLRLQFGRRRIEDLVDLPLTLDNEHLAYAYLCIYTGTVAYFIDVNLFSFIATRGLNILIKFGNFELSPLAYNAMGSILGSGLGLYKQGYRFGQTSIRLYNKMGGIKSRSKIFHVFVFINLHWKEHAKKGLDYEREAYKAGLQAGDLLYCGYNINVLAMHRIILGDNLDEILEEYVPFKEFQMNAKDPFTPRNYKENTQMILCLKGQTLATGKLNGNGYDEDDQIAFYIADGNMLGQVYTLTAMLKVRYLFGLYKDCADICLKVHKLIKKKAAIGTLHIPEFYFFDSLHMTAVYENAVFGEKFKLRIKLKLNQMKMKTWANHCPENFEHKYLLVEAEIARIKGHHKKAVDLFNAAIKSARENKYTQNEAIANELAARLMMKLNNREAARQYMQEAHYGYIRWGATAKANDLEEKYPELTKGMPQNSYGGPPTHTETAMTFSGTSGIQTLDLSTVIKTSQSLSSEIDLGKLLAEMMRLSIENAGAQKGFLILENESDQKLYVEAEGGAGQILQVLKGQPLNDHGGVSISMVNFVARTKEMLILNNATTEGAYTLDPYVVENKPKSILCMPVIRQSKLVGVLYLENNIATGAFTPDRVNVLDLLASQAAISIENAKMYENVRQARQKVLNLLETANEGFWQVDNKGVTVDVNSEMCSILGRLRDEIIGHSVFEFSDEENASITRSQKDILNQQKKCEFEVAVIRPDGSRVECLVKATILYDGENSGWFSMVTDITERKRAEEKVRTLNAELEQRVLDRTRELNMTLEDVKIANSHIMESIRYAKMIQQSMLPNQTQLKSWLPDSFIIWEPRDIIGGDFFFSDAFDGGCIMAVVDCTGHGVPGALMTMIAVSGLKKIIRDEGCRSPAQILKRLNAFVKTSLQQETEHALSDDGLDAGMCYVDANSKTLTFAGAKVPLMYVDKGELTVIKGDKQSIGYSKSNLDFTYSEHHIPLDNSPQFYMASDGYTDQLGGNKKMRFGSKRFQQLILDNSLKPFEEQRNILLNIFNDYKSEYNRQDDVTVVGFSCDHFVGFR
ncbi:MAG: AAA family ATPase [Proteobacteria bacterium]|nr:AAA family ATPase [Pseudomonadota bacterium]